MYEAASMYACMCGHNSTINFISVNKKANVSDNDMAVQCGQNAEIVRRTIRQRRQKETKEAHLWKYSSVFIYHVMIIIATAAATVFA